MERLPVCISHLAPSRARRTGTLYDSPRQNRRVEIAPGWRPVCPTPLAVCRADHLEVTAWRSMNPRSIARLSLATLAAVTFITSNYPFYNKRNICAGERIAVSSPISPRLFLMKSRGRSLATAITSVFKHRRKSLPEMRARAKYIPDGCSGPGSRPESSPSRFGSPLPICWAHSSAVRAGDS